LRSASPRRSQSGLASLPIATMKAGHVSSTPSGPDRLAPLRLLLVAALVVLRTCPRCGGTLSARLSSSGAPPARHGSTRPSPGVFHVNLSEVLESRRHSDLRQHGLALTGRDRGSTCGSPGSPPSAVQRRRSSTANTQPPKLDSVSIHLRRRRAFWTHRVTDGLVEECGGMGPERWVAIVR
jgi:hypothetical protein